MLNEKIYVFDDIIDLSHQNYIRDLLIRDYELDGKYPFPWYYLDDITLHESNPNNQGRPGFTHEYVIYGGKEKLTGIQVSQFHDIFVSLLQDACKKVGITNVNILQGRSFLQVPLNLKDRSVDTPHIDINDRDDFFVVLYYVCDSDGDTIIYNETKESDQYTIKQRVTPKKGRVVIFDGKLMHTAEQPLNNTRCIVNYNLG
jgi:hypothetical protein